jgi:hypothetical protein
MESGHEELQSQSILKALHARTHEEFREAIEPLLTEDEREHIAVAEPLMHQLAMAYDAVVERLTQRWSRLNDWPPFARVVEPGENLKRGLRACTLELFKPSRGLDGRVAFRAEVDLRWVTQPIPVPVLRVVRENAGTVFRAVTFLEPIYAVGRKRGQGQPLRSLASVRRQHCRPVDPIVVGWLGSGPRNYGLWLPLERRGEHGFRNPPPRTSSRGELVFLIGHWD